MRKHTMRACKSASSQQKLIPNLCSPNLPLTEMLQTVHEPKTEDRYQLRQAPCSHLSFLYETNYKINISCVDVRQKTAIFSKSIFNEHFRILRWQSNPLDVTNFLSREMFTSATLEHRAGICPAVNVFDGQSTVITNQKEHLSASDQFCRQELSL